MPARRNLLLALGALLGGCGFRPMLKQVNDTGVQSELAAVEVKTSTDRLGFLVRDNLLDELNPTGAEVPTRYVLQVSVQQRSSALAIQLDNTATRFNLTLTAQFSLLDASSRKVLYKSVVRRVASYNAIQAPYAEFAAEQDAGRRAAREVGTDIRTQLAIHFVREAEART